MVQIEDAEFCGDDGARAERVGSPSGDLVRFARLTAEICGTGRTLDLGSGEGWLVGELLQLGIDAIGVDVSHASVERANNRFPNRFSVASILNLPFRNDEFETVVSINCLEHLAAEDVPRALAEIHRVVRRFALLQIATTPDQENSGYLTIEGRQWWEDQFFQAGFRKAPGYYTVNRYQNLNHDDRHIHLVLEKVPSDAQRRTPHPPKDMSRRSGLDSDRTLFPYHWAKDFARPGDRVLDLSLIDVFGPYMLYQDTEVASVVTLTSEHTYARANFGSQSPAVEFLPEDPLGFIQKAQTGEYDLVIGFSPESAFHLSSSLTECSRVLSPGGRLLLAIEDRAPLSDPGAGALETALSTLMEHAGAVFHLETIVLQDRRIVVEGREATIRAIDVVSQPCDIPPGVARLLVALIKDPTRNSAPFRETIHGYSKPPKNLLAFERDYDNPWLVRSLLSMPNRAKSKSALLRIANTVLTQSGGKASPDVGASLAVLGYRLLETPDIHASTILEFVGKLDVFLARPSRNAHSIRWRISLNFLAGKLQQKMGKLGKAVEYFEKTLEIPFSKFSMARLGAQKPRDISRLTR